MPNQLENTIINFYEYPHVEEYHYNEWQPDQYDVQRQVVSVAKVSIFRAPTFQKVFPLSFLFKMSS